MESPFPGIDPYLEHPWLWPDVHHRLIAALADNLGARVAPRYYDGRLDHLELQSTNDPSSLISGLACGLHIPDLYCIP